MVEIRDGQILTLDQIQNNNFTYNGKEVKFTQNENNPNVYEGKLQLTEEEKKAGNLERAFSYNVGTAQGTITSYVITPQTEDFQDLTDSEKVTKLNSLAFQHNTNEPTDIGSTLDMALEKDVGRTQPQNKEELNKVLQEQEQQKNQKQQQQKQQQQKQKQETTNEQQPQEQKKVLSASAEKDKEFNLSNVKS